jgi:hypothetical protein
MSVSRRIAFVTILVVAMAAVAVAAGCGSVSKTAKEVSPSPSFTPPPAWVMAIATKQVRNSDAHPVEAWWTLVTVPVHPRDRQAYIVVFHGEFASPSINYQTGATPRVVHWLTLTLDVETQMVSVVSLSDKGPSAQRAAKLHPFQL